VAARLDNRVSGAIGALPAAAAADALERLPEVLIYSVDPIVRRAPSLQQTADARAPKARVSPATLARLAGLADGATVRVSMAAGGDALVQLAADPKLADGVLRLAAGHESTARLAAMTGAARIERA
jgi:NADH-quinone oxidoreductase subunit G